MSDPRGEGVIGIGRPAGGRRAAIAALGAVVIWSTNALAAGAALDRLTLIQVLALQFGAAAIALGVARHRRVARGRRDGVSRRRLTARGVAVAVVGLTGTIALQYLAFATAPLVAANAVAYAWPLLVAAWVALVAHPRASRAPLALALAGFAGVLLIFFQRGGGGDGASAPLPGYLAALGSAVAMASYTLAVGRVAASRADLLFVATLAGAVVTVPVAVAQGDSWSSGAAISLGLYAGVGPMAGGYALWTHAMSHPSGAQLAPIAYATPLLSTLVLLATGERLTMLGLVGCALIVACAAGVVIDTRRSHAASRASSEPGNAGRGLAPVTRRCPRDKRERATPRRPIRERAGERQGAVGARVHAEAVAGPQDAQPMTTPNAIPPIAEGAQKALLSSTGDLWAG